MPSYDAPSVASNRDIPQVMDKLQGAIENQEKLIEELSQRVAPLLAQPSAATPAETEKAMQSQFGTRVNDLAVRVQSANKQLRLLIESIQI
jgi:hypothetical protein